MKKSLALILACLMLIGALAGCGKPEAPEPTVEPTPTPLPETREFTDSTGRTVTIPYEVDKIAVSGK